MAETVPTTNTEENKPKWKEFFEGIFGKIKDVFKNIKDKLPNFGSKKMQLCYQMMQEMENAVDELIKKDEITDERLAQVYSVVSDLSQHVADLNPDNVDRYVESIQQAGRKISDIVKDGAYFTKESMEEAVGAVFSPEEQQHVNVFITSDNHVLLNGISGDYMLKPTGNIYMLERVSEEERKKIDFSALDKVNPRGSLGDTVTDALQKSLNRANLELAGMSDQLRYAEILKNLTDGKCQGSPSGIYSMFDKEQGTFLIENNEKHNMISIKIENGQANIYFHESSRYFVSSQQGVLVGNITQDNIGNGYARINATTTDWNKAGLDKETQAMVKELLQSEYARAALISYGDSAAEDLIKNTAGKESRLNRTGQQKAGKFANEMKSLIKDENISVNVLKSEKGIAVQMNFIDGHDKATYYVNFTRNGELAGYSYQNDNGAVAVMTKNGTVLDEKIANTESFRKMTGMIATAVERVNMTFDGNMYIPKARVDNIPITVAEKRQPVLYSEERLRKDLGDEKFEQATEVFRKLIDRVELPCTSPDGTEDGYYSEIRGMPEEEKDKFVRETGLLLKKNENILQMNDQQLRAVAYYACKNQPRQYMQILNFESFATGCMEAVHDVRSQKSGMEVGAKIMSSLIMEQNIRREQDLRNDYQNVFDMSRTEADFIPEEQEQILNNMMTEQTLNNMMTQHIEPADAEPELNYMPVREPAEWIRIQQLDNEFHNLILNIQQNPMPIEYVYSDSIPPVESAIVKYAQEKGIIVPDDNKLVLNENFAAQMQNALPMEARQFAEQNQEIIPLPMPEPAPEYQQEPEFYQPDIPDMFEH